MPARILYRIRVKAKNWVQYTIRQVPARIDRSLRQKSKQARQSLNESAIDSLTKEVGLADEQLRYHDLDPLAGTWQEDAAFDAAMVAQDQVDSRLWK